MVIEAPFDFDKTKKVNLWDVAVIQFEPNSYHEGKVTLINRRGINITTNCGDRFVKWSNVLKVIKDDMFFDDLPTLDIPVETRFEKCKVIETGLFEPKLDFSKEFQIVFYHHSAQQMQTFRVEAKNKHQARHKFWEKYPWSKFCDSTIELIEEL